MVNSEWFLHMESWSNPTPRNTKKFITAGSIRLIDQSLYLADLAPVDVFLFPKTKGTMAVTSIDPNTFKRGGCKTITMNTYEASKHSELAELRLQVDLAQKLIHIHEIVKLEEPHSYTVFTLETKLEFFIVDLETGPLLHFESLRQFKDACTAFETTQNFDLLQLAGIHIQSPSCSLNTSDLSYIPGVSVGDFEAEEVNLKASDMCMNKFKSVWKIWKESNDRKRK
ncbi:unnamed protein product [Lepeophtheirus salmonis]|uniref:(salmon louse) hypothetical protein n=1 Tax=Lepeophtheirus salmonis TaxID=72036 RepID=A0A7R8H523_LEPSM|nr:unnamed protein product [Lepeophtheirus salmonis]CAF2854893.1 unnamed protein product [Lepeophtheirus salmonis]